MPITSRFVIQTASAFLTVGFLALFLIVGMTNWLSNRAENFTDALAVHTDLRNQAMALRDALRTAESSERGFLLTGNEIYLAPYETARAQVNRNLAGVVAHLQEDPAAAKMLARLVTVITDRLDGLQSAVAFKTAGREDEVAAILRTNRGKALMDEANLFLTGIILAADERLSESGLEQRQNAQMLTTVSLASALVIVVVVTGVAITVVRYTREIAYARDEVRAANVNLEDRVQHRTADLDRARERAEILLKEVNHRVANSLQLVAAFVKFQSNAVKSSEAKEALAETQSRITAISLIHKKLYTSSDVHTVSLDDYIGGLLDHLETALRTAGYTASLKHKIAPVQLPTDDSVSLGVIVTEWVTNAFKYAYPDGGGEIRVFLTCLPDNLCELVVEDDGVGRNDAPQPQGTGVGTRVVTGMAANLDGQIDYINRSPGTAARLAFKTAAA